MTCSGKPCKTTAMRTFNRFNNFKRKPAFEVACSKVQNCHSSNADFSISSPAHLAQMQKNQQHQQAAMMQQMQREGSDIDINGQRPRTPSLSDNAPSPSKRPRLDGTPFNTQQMMANGRIPPQGLQGQQLANNPSALHANNLLMQYGINPSALSETQFQSFQQQNPQVQQKSIQVYAQNLAQHQRSAMSNQNMPKGMPNQPGMPNHGSPMMQPGPDGVAGISDFYPNNPAVMRGVQPPNGQNGNHALQDYQMQLMLLEQQNKKRLLMARQEQEGKDSMPRPDGQPGMAGQPGIPPGTGMSPQGSRSGPSPNPNDQMARGTPKMGQTGLPVSPLPDGSMPQARSSPAPMMAFNAQMPPEIFQMKTMGDGMGGLQQPNGNGMRPPSSHPGGFNGAQYTHPQMEAVVRAQQQGRMPGANWQGAQGQAPMLQQTGQSQQPQQLGTPQQRNAMPPPQAPPAGAQNNGRPASPQQPAAPPTPHPAIKQNPKGKKDTKEPRKVSYNPAFRSTSLAAAALTWYHSVQRKKYLQTRSVLVRPHLPRRKTHLRPQPLQHPSRLCIRPLSTNLAMANPAPRHRQPRVLPQRLSRLSSRTLTLSLHLLQSTRRM